MLEDDAFYMGVIIYFFGKLKMFIFAILVNLPFDLTGIVVGIKRRQIKGCNFTLDAV